MKLSGHASRVGIVPHPEVEELDQVPSGEAFSSPRIEVEDFVHTEDLTSMRNSQFIETDDARTTTFRKVVHLEEVPNSEDEDICSESYIVEFD